MRANTVYKALLSNHIIATEAVGIALEFLAIAILIDIARNKVDEEREGVLHLGSEVPAFKR